jgi:hypothetical protein
LALWELLAKDMQEGDRERAWGQCYDFDNFGVKCLHLAKKYCRVLKTRGPCFDFKNIFAEKMDLLIFSTPILMPKVDHHTYCFFGIFCRIVIIILTPAVEI